MAVHEPITGIVRFESNCDVATLLRDQNDITSRRVPGVIESDDFWCWKRSSAENGKVVAVQVNLVGLQHGISTSQQL